MKKAIILIVTLFLLSLPSGFSIGMAKIENYTHVDGAFSFGNSQCTASTFTIGTTTMNTNYNLSKITIQMTGVGTSLNVCLYSTIGGDPASPLVCNLSNTEITALFGGSAAKRNISMPLYILNASTKYAIVLNSSHTLGTYTVDGDDEASPQNYGGGNYLYAGGTCTGWSTITGRIILFEVWSENGTNIGNDLMPPEITYYNLTNGDGCENWNTNKSNPCNTSSVTPTVQFNTSENAWCAIAGSNSSTALDLNITDMGSSRNCTGAASGEGLMSHFCTLTTQDEFVYDTSYLFISCRDPNNNQNRTSTSGALKLNITDLENTARNSIATGIRNALLTGYTIYTDQRIYARNSANNQAIGLFDKIAKKNNKIWAFNNIGVSDSHINMFNITPVFYNLEFSNKTATQIINLTEKMINATK